MGLMPLKIPRQRAREPETPGVRGAVRVDARTKDLTKRLRPGEIAVIDHQDIDKVSAEALLACRPAAVVNASPSISGRYPNLGPEILVEAGIPLIDNVGKDVMHDLKELKDAGETGADDEHRAEEALQKLTDEKVKELDALLKGKEAEILEV